MRFEYAKWTEIALNGDPFPREDAYAILTDRDIDLLQLAAAAGDVRIARFGRKVQVHQINNIKNGLCPEDCGYCGQSKVSDAPVRRYPTKTEDEIVREAHEAKSQGVYRYCMVASGRGPTKREADALVHTLERIREEVGIHTCLSVGLVDDETAQRFKDAGLNRLNHNLNTSARHSPKIVSTHTYDDRINTLKAATGGGLEVCSGMICGMGETDDDILDVAYALRGFEAPSIPVNFLVPIEGNPVYDFHQLTPERCVRILCAFRFINPTAEIRIGGGREGHLRGLQSLALYPANSLFVEGYLVSRGDAKRKAYRMIEDAGFEVDGVWDRDEIERGFELDDNPSVLNPKTTLLQIERGED
ncbi:MAG: biotin synthase BioB [Candidatus Poribacteria bacterium]|nr:biotin synthase BioB [Candidatus Poribacteria bacterium]